MTVGANTALLTIYKKRRGVSKNGKYPGKTMGHNASHHQTNRIKFELIMRMIS